MTPWMVSTASAGELESGESETTPPITARYLPATLNDSVDSVILSSRKRHWNSLSLETRYQQKKMLTNCYSNFFEKKKAIQATATPKDSLTKW